VKYGATFSKPEYSLPLVVRSRDVALLHYLLLAGSMKPSLHFSKIVCIASKGSLLSQLYAIPVVFPAGHVLNKPFCIFDVY
jgi:hypothetical protein